MDFAAAPCSKLIAMVAHGDEQAELPLLLRLCGDLVEGGYPVTVLDGTARESADNPGLEQLLDHGYAPRPTEGSLNWAVVPASAGLQTLANRNLPHHPAIADTGALFPYESVVIIYSTAQTLASLLRGSPVRPVLTVSEGKASLLTSYLALKRLLLQGGLQPTVVNMVRLASAAQPAGKGASANAGLRDYAKYFLDYDVNAFTISTQGVDDLSNTSTSRLALGLLESALPLQTDWGSMLSGASNHPVMPQVLGRH